MTLSRTGHLERHSEPEPVQSFAECDQTSSPSKRVRSEAGHVPRLPLLQELDDLLLLGGRQLPLLRRVAQFIEPRVNLAEGRESIREDDNRSKGRKPSRVAYLRVDGFESCVRGYDGVGKCGTDDCHLSVSDPPARPAMRRVSSACSTAKAARAAVGCATYRCPFEKTRPDSRPLGRLEVHHGHLVPDDRDWPGELEHPGTEEREGRSDE